MVEKLYNILTIEKEAGLALPKWTDKVYPEKLLALAERNLAVLTENDFMKRVKGGLITFNSVQMNSTIQLPSINHENFYVSGYLVTDILDKMIQMRSNQSKPNRNLYIYSGHDVTLVNTIRALNISSQTSRKPDYGAALYFELHQNPDLANDLEIKVN